MSVKSKSLLRLIDSKSPLAAFPIVARPPVSRTVAALLLSTALTGGALAQTVWTGAGGNDFNFAGNWSAGAPNAGVTANIAATANAPTLSAGGAANTLNLDLNTLSITPAGTLFVTGALSVQSVAGQLINQGAINAGGGILNSGIVHNSTAGSIIVGGVNNLTPTSVLNNIGVINGGVVNSGAVNATAASSVINGGLSNNGNGVVSAMGTITGVINNMGNATFVVAGALGTDSAFNNNGASQLAVTGGNLTLGGLLTNNNTALVSVGAGRTLTATGVTNITGATIVNAGNLNSGTPVANGGALHNNASGIVNGGVNNNAAASVLTNAGTVNGGLNNIGTVVSTGTINGGVSNNTNGVMNASGTVTGLIENANNGIFVVTGNLATNAGFDNEDNAQLAVTGGNLSLGGALANTSTNPAGVSIGAGRTLTATAVTNGAGATIINAGNLNSGAIIANSGTLHNNAGGLVIGGVNNNAAASVLNNAGTINGGVTNIGTVNSATAGSIINGGLTNNADGIVNAAGTITGVINNNNNGIFVVAGNLGTDNAFNNNAANTQLAVVGGNLVLGGALTNNSLNAAGVSIGAGRTLTTTAVTNAAGATIINAGTLTSAAVIGNAGNLHNTTAASTINGGVNNSAATALITNIGTINGGVTNVGTVITNAATSVINGGLTNNVAGIVQAAGQINGAIVNNATGLVVVNGPLASNGTFTNNNTAQLAVVGGNYAISGALTNNSTHAAGVSVAAGMTLSAATVNNATAASNVILGAASTLQSTVGALDNNGIINVGAGGIITSAAAVNNNAGGQMIFNNGGTITSATNTITNAGTIQVVAGNLAMNGNVSGAGTLNMANGVTGQTTNVAGTYTGGILTADFDLGTRASDQLIVAGGTGPTTVNLSRTGGAAVVGANITIVQGATAAAVYTVNGTAIANGQSVLIDNAGVLQNLAFNNGGNLVIQQSVNAGAVAGFSSAVSSVLSSLNSFSEPASAFVTGPANPDPNKFSMGGWSRLRAGEFNVKSQTSILGSSITNTIRNEFRGFQVGFDGGVYNINNTGWNAVLGVHGGQVAGSGGNGDSNVTLDQPFYGAYVVLKNNAFTFDAMIRRDLIDMKVSSSSGGFSKQKLSAQGWSGLVSGQYRIGVTDTITVTPSLAFMFSRIDVGTLNAAPGVSATWKDIQSMTGRAGVDISTVYQISSQAFLVPFANASVWHEFAGKVQATTLGIPSTTNRVGTYAQFSLGAALTSPTPGFTGFLRGDLRVGSRIDGYALNGGVRYQF